MKFEKLGILALLSGITSLTGSCGTTNTVATNPCPGIRIVRVVPCTPQPAVVVTTPPPVQVIIYECGGCHDRFATLSEVQKCGKCIAQTQVVVVQPPTQQVVQYAQPVQQVIQQQPQVVYMQQQQPQQQRVYTGGIYQRRPWDPPPNYPTTYGYGGIYRRESHTSEQIWTE